MRRGYQEADTLLLLNTGKSRNAKRTMYEGNPVDLQMEKVISADAILDETTHQCQVFTYDMEEDYIYLELKGRRSDGNSLWMQITECYISTRNMNCSAVQEWYKERYQSEDGNILESLD